jgi:hypothetical protein
MAKVRLRDVFGPAFWLNYGVSLIVTLWVPFAHLRFKDEETGKVIRESYPAVYEIYLDVIQNPNTWSAYKYIGAHLGIVFAISALVWYLVARRQAARASDPVAAHES